MNIDRQMVNLFFEVRKNVPAEIRQGMKLSSPTLGSDLVAIFNIIDNDKVKFAIERFFKRAGDADNWLSEIQDLKHEHDLANNLAKTL